LLDVTSVSTGLSRLVNGAAFHYVRRKSSI
jgi:hypothetical protein